MKKAWKLEKKKKKENIDPIAEQARPLDLMRMRTERQRSKHVLIKLQGRRYHKVIKEKSFTK